MTPPTIAPVCSADVDVLLASMVVGTAFTLTSEEFDEEVVLVMGEAIELELEVGSEVGIEIEVEVKIRVRVEIEIEGEMKVEVVDEDEVEVKVEIRDPPKAEDEDKDEDEAELVVEVEIEIAARVEVGVEVEDGVVTLCCGKHEISLELVTLNEFELAISAPIHAWICHCPEGTSTSHV